MACVGGREVVWRPKAATRPHALCRPHFHLGLLCLLLLLLLLLVASLTGGLPAGCTVLPAAAASCARHPTSWLAGC